MCMYTFYETNQVRSFIVNIIAMNEKIYDYMWKKNFLNNMIICTVYLEFSNDNLFYNIHICNKNKFGNENKIFIEWINSPTSNKK